MIYLNQLTSKLTTSTATEHTHRPALANLFEALEGNLRAINEPRRIACGAPDLAILRGDFKVGHVEAKDVGVSLDAAERTEQLLRYREALDNLILTDYLEFRWYVNGNMRSSVRLARLDTRGVPQLEANGIHDLKALLTDFLAHQPQPISTPRELAEHMARQTHLIRDVIMNAFTNKQASEMLKGWRRAFAQVLIPDLDQPENLGQFADMFAQTLSYGLFSARIMHESGTFHRYTAQYSIPRTNPFLRNFFTFITGPHLDDEPFAGLVDDLIQLLANADIHAILADFGRNTRQDDPMMHFYETFLAAYDPRLRERRGVYYTPMPVVSFIVRSVHSLLKNRFGLPDGLADTTRLPDGTHKMLILDPAVGTATFLYAVIDLIRDEFMQRNDAGMWSDYVREHLLARLFGFEIMMAPYAVAHFKLALQLAGHDLDLPEEERARWAYDFQAEDRIRVYLTNALEVMPENIPSLYGPMQFVSEEAKAADAVKQEKPIMVVLGNPPYSVSSINQGEHIETLMERYKTAVRSERNIQPLSDDYIKFIRFAHDRIERTGTGIVAMITNHVYLSGLVHRGMREELINSFDEIFILNLHGNSLIGEVTPSGSPDENVFDIRQGVSIVFLVISGERSGETMVKYLDFWGRRNEKYQALLENDIFSLEWMNLSPEPPYFMLIDQNKTLSDEYDSLIKVSNIFNSFSMGITTGRDSFSVNFSFDTLKQRLRVLKSEISNEEIRQKYHLVDSSSFSLENARNWARNSDFAHAIHTIDYRCFDQRKIIYSSFVLGRDRHEVSKHLLNKSNINLITMRSVRDQFWKHSFISSQITVKEYISSLDNCYFFPIYFYPEENINPLFDTSEFSAWDPDNKNSGRIPNFNPRFMAEFEGKLELIFDPHLAGRTHPIRETFGPEDLLAYIYAIFHSPSYRERYAEFLKIDFPRVPLTADVEMFRRLVSLGRELIALHLMESPLLNSPLTSFPIPGDSLVTPRGGYPKYVPPEAGYGGRVYINREQYFEGVNPEVWAFEIGGYQVLHKWLKDRRGRELSFINKRHYQQVVVALVETMRLMEEIDAAIPGWPLT